MLLVWILRPIVTLPWTRNLPPRACFSATSYHPSAILFSALALLAKLQQLKMSTAPTPSDLAVAATLPTGTTLVAGSAAIAEGSRLGVLPVVAGTDEFREVDLSAFPLDHHLIHSGLRGETKIANYTVYLSKDKRRLRTRAQLGEQICGHPSIVHGGALASLLDDALGTLFVSAGYNGFTANLSVNYKRPVPAGSKVLVSAEVGSIEASASKPGTLKVHMIGRISSAPSAEAAGCSGESAEPIVFTEATALFITKDVPRQLAKQ